MVEEDKVINNSSGDRNPSHIAAIQRITWIGMVGNLLLSGMKFTVGIMGASQAVVADAVHSISDISTDIAILFGVKYWSAPADEEHPFGHGRIETIITACIGVFLGVVAVGIAFNAIITVREEHLTQPRWIAFAGAVVSIFIKEILYRWTVSAGKRVNSAAVIANAWHHRSDALSSIPVAGTVVLAAINPKWSYLDHLGALIVSLVILHVAWGILKSSFKELTDSGVPSDVQAQIRDLALANKDVMSVHAIRTRKIGSGIYVDLHIMVDPQMTVQEGHNISESVKQKLLDKGPDIIDVIVHLEPFERIPK